MREVTARLAVGLVLVVLVTLAVAGTVATAAAISDELSDGDGCETGGRSIGTATATPENVTALAGNVTGCIGGDDDADTPRSEPTARSD